MGKKITDEERKIIKQEALSGTSCKDIAKLIGRHYSSVKRYLNANNLPSNPKKYGIQYEDYEPIFELYNSGLTLQKIHDEYYPQYTTDQINYIVREKGITRPNGKVSHLNHNYFSEIDSVEKAYWLGLLTADGNVQYRKERGESYKITLDLNSEDEYLVEKFKNAINSNLNVHTYINNTSFQRKDGQPHKMARITVHSAQMYKDLGKYGIVERKSLLLEKVPYIKDEYLSHYLRGFFDGNGSITYGNKKAKYFSPRVLFYSTYNFCKSVQESLNKVIGLPIHTITKQKDYNVSFITYGKFDDVVAIYNFLYKDATIYMKRKKEKFEEYISQYRDNHNM